MIGQIFLWVFSQSKTFSGAFGASQFRPKGPCSEYTDDLGLRTVLFGRGVVCGVGGGRVCCAPTTASQPCGHHVTCIAQGTVVIGFPCETDASLLMGRFVHLLMSCEALRPRLTCISLGLPENGHKARGSVGYGMCTKRA